MKILIKILNKEHLKGMVHIYIDKIKNRNLNILMKMEIYYNNGYLNIFEKIHIKINKHLPTQNNKILIFLK
jgi:hypothetical protein